MLQLIIALLSSNWQVLSNGPIPLTNDNNGSLIFTFPVDNPPNPCPHNKHNKCGYIQHPTINYLFTPMGDQDLLGYSNILMSIEVTTTGSPIFLYDWDGTNNCVNPASVRLYFQKSGDNYSDEFGRWWANPISYELQAGAVTMTVPLTPDQWSSVYGKFGTDAPSEWQSALQRVGNVGMTFGGGCFFGHGVNVSGGTAQFLVLGYTIN